MSVGNVNSELFASTVPIRPKLEKIPVDSLSVLIACNTDAALHKYLIVLLQSIVRVPIVVAKWAVKSSRTFELDGTSFRCNTISYYKLLAFLFVASVA